MNISTEYILCRHQNGVQLVSPKELFNDEPVISDIYYSLDKIFNHSFCVYFLDCDGKVQISNEFLAAMYDSESPRQLVGKDIFHFSKKDAADRIRANDLEVMRNHKIKILQEKIDPRYNNIHATHFLTIKSPCYDDKYTLTGIFGLSIIFDIENIGESLSSIMQMGFLNTFAVHMQAMNIHSYNNNILSRLSPRENQIVIRLAKGYTLKEIAYDLRLSIRTVEFYINNIKDKLGLNSKSDIIKAYYRIVRPQQI